jgi:peroxiredoxin
MPLLDAASAKFGLSVVGIGIDSADKIREFIAKIGVRYETLVAGAAAIELMKGLGNSPGGLPFTLIIDRAGRIASRKLGPLGRAELEGIVAPLLR